LKPCVQRVPRNTHGPTASLLLPVLKVNMLVLATQPAVHGMTRTTAHDVRHAGQPRCVTTKAPPKSTLVTSAP